MQVFPEPLIFTEQLRKLAVHHGRKEAVIDHGGVLDYQELWSAIEAVAGGLQAAGVRPGDRVATAMAPSAPHLVVILGCMAAGAIATPLNIRLTSAEFRRFLAPIKPVLIICDAEHAEKASDLGAPVQVLADADAQGSIRDRLAGLWSETAPTTVPGELDIALIIPTGGTTGVPKGAMFTHRGIFLWSASCSYNAGRLREDVELFFSAFFHISIITGWMSTLFAAGTTRILRAFSAEEALDAIEQGATFMMGAPTMYTMLQRHPDFGRIDRSRMRFMAIGSTAMTEEFVLQLRSDFPNARLRHSYAATEFGPVSGMLHDDFLAGRLSGVGRALQNCRLTVVDDQLRPLPAGEIGELVVASPWQTVGYWGMPEETAATYTPIGVRLGDLGRIDADGWISIAGRKKEMIISGGENVFPNEVEAVLSRHPAIGDISVYGVKDPHWGERVEAAVTLKPGAALTHADLVAFGRTQLGGYKLPKSMRVVDAIPLTPNNKPDRRRLAQEAEASASSDARNSADA